MPVSRKKDEVWVETRLSNCRVGSILPSWRQFPNGGSRVWHSSCKDATKRMRYDGLTQLRPPNAQECQCFKSNVPLTKVKKRANPLKSECTEPEKVYKNLSTTIILFRDMMQDLSIYLVYYLSMSEIGHLIGSMHSRSYVHRESGFP